MCRISTNTVPITPEELALYKSDDPEVAWNKARYRLDFQAVLLHYLVATDWRVTLFDIAKHVRCTPDYLNEALTGRRPFNSSLARRTAEAMWDLVNEPRGS